MTTEGEQNIKWNRVSENSPLRVHPVNISERQIIYLDGIRYSAEMAGIAIDRLWSKLCQIDRQFMAEETTSSSDIAEAALDAWSIVDAAHRFSDLVEGLPGLPNAHWRRLLKNRLRDAEALRDAWQHMRTHSDKVVADRGQAWGALAWMQHAGIQPTGRWFLAVIGSDLNGSSWTAGGPSNAIQRVGTRRIRLLHDNRVLYLTRVVKDMFEAVANLERVLTNDEMKLVGERVNQQRSSDYVMFMALEVLRSID